MLLWNITGYLFLHPVLSVSIKLRQSFFVWLLISLTMVFKSWVFINVALLNPTSVMSVYVFYGDTEGILLGFLISRNCG